MQDVLWRPTTAAAALDYLTEQAPGLMQRCVADLLLDAACGMRCAIMIHAHPRNICDWWVRAERTAICCQPPTGMQSLQHKRIRAVQRPSSRSSDQSYTSPHPSLL